MSTQPLPPTPPPSASSRAGLTIADVSVDYGNHRAVDHVNLTIPHGEVLALLGPSGSGKSSLLRGVAGLEPLATGDIAWDGHSVTTTPVHRRGFGVMFQIGQLFAHRDVSGNVSYGLRGMPAAQRSARVAEMLALVGMSGYAARQVNTLSGGQAQRVALARALAPRPRLLLLDEPLSSLDRARREHLSAEIRHILTSLGSTGIYVTHDQDEAFAVADRIAVLMDGRVGRLGPPGEVWDQPRRQDVAAFLGYGPFLPIRSLPGMALAVAPDAVRVIDVDLATHPVAGDLEAAIDEAVVTDRPIDLLVRGGDVRVGQGFADVDIALGAQPARARLTELPPDVHALSGTELVVRVDVARCRVVAT